MGPSDPCDRELAAAAIWLPGGLPETSQPACAAGSAPVSYYPEECLSSEKKRLLLPAAFSIISAFGECGSQEDGGGNHKTLKMQTYKVSYIDKYFVPTPPLFYGMSLYFIFFTFIYGEP